MPSIINLPKVSMNVHLNIAHTKGGHYKLPFNIRDAEITRQGNDLSFVITENGQTGSLVLMDYFLDDGKSIKFTDITDTLFSANEIVETFVAMDDPAKQDKPAAGPQDAQPAQQSAEPAKLDAKLNSARFRNYGDSEMVDGIDHLNGIDYTSNRQINYQQRTYNPDYVEKSNIVPADVPLKSLNDSVSLNLDEADITDSGVSNMVRAKLFNPGSSSFAQIKFANVSDLSLEGASSKYTTEVSGNTLKINFESSGSIIIAIDGFDPSGNVVLSFGMNGAVSHSGDIITINGLVFEGIDAKGNSAFNSGVSLTIKDDVPTASDDFVKMTESDTTVSGNLAGKTDFGADGARNENAFELVSSSDGKYGSIVLNPDGSYTYTLGSKGVPAAGGVDEFTYRAYDADGDFVEQKITVNVADVPPVTNGFIPLSLSDRSIGSSLSDKTTSVEQSAKLFNGPIDFDKAVFETGNIKVNGNSSYQWTISPDGQTLGGRDKNGHIITLTIEKFDAEGNITVSASMTGTAFHENTDKIDITGIAIRAYDLSGSSVINKGISLSIEDSRPSGEDDIANMVETDPSVSGDVSLNDDPGNDGWRANPYELVGKAEGTYGTIKLNGDGTYTYERNSTATPLDGGIETYTYRAYDKDGDYVEKTVTIYIESRKGVTIAPETPGEDIAGSYDIPLDPEHPIVKPEGEKQSVVTVYENQIDTEAGAAAAGNLYIDAPDGLMEVKINGVSVWKDGAVTSTNAIDSHTEGKLIVTGYDAATHLLSYKFVLEKTTQEHKNAGADILSHTFEVVATDQKSLAGKTYIKVNVVDDIPQIKADKIELVEDDNLSATGNVLDTYHFGADGMQSFEWIDNPASSKYGDVVLNADGSYSYVLKNNLPEIQKLTVIDGKPESLSETFRYKVVDKDGDEAESTLTITILGKDDGVSVVPVNKILHTEITDAVVELDPANPVNIPNDAYHSVITVNEKDLRTNATTESAVDTLKIDALDGLSEITINGAKIWTAKDKLIASEINGHDGKLVITGYNENTGELSYKFVLEKASSEHNQTNANEAFLHNFKVTATDRNGSQGNSYISVKIEDDKPETVSDSKEILANHSALVEGNVLANDTFGADGKADANSFEWLTAGGKTAYGTITLNNDGTYSYTLDKTNANVLKLIETSDPLVETFTYKITDKDGDYKTDTLTIKISGVNDPIIVSAKNPVPVDASVPDLPFNAEQPRDDTKPVSQISVKESDIGTDNAEQTGQITINAPDGLKEISLGGVAVWNKEAGLLPVHSVSSPEGTLTITNVDAATGIVDYKFILENSTTRHTAAGNDNVSTSFKLIAKDEDNSEDFVFISVKIEDDVAVANNDADNVYEDGIGGASQITGNVLDNDSFGKDGHNASGYFEWTGDKTAKYGDVILNNDGSYEYKLKSDLAVVQGLKPGETLTETFTYKIVDKDGDTSTATLTITVNGSNDLATITAEDKTDFSGVENNKANINVDEANLECDASGDVAKTITQSGAIKIDAPDGLAKITIDGKDVWLYNSATKIGGLTGNLQFATDEGRLTINSYENGRLTYTYELLRPTQEHTGHDKDVIDVYSHSFNIRAEDRNGDDAEITLSINIKDDNPEAKPDAAEVKSSDHIANGNVLLNDNFGADGLREFKWLDNKNEPINITDEQTINTKYGEITLYANGSYTYTLNRAHPDVLGLLTDEPLTETFSYKIIDKDGDESVNSITVSIRGENDPVIVTPGNSTAIDTSIPDLPYETGVIKDPAIHKQSEILVNELAIGTDDAVQRGSMNIDAPDGLGTITIGGVEVYNSSKGGLIDKNIETPEGILKVTGVNAVDALNYNLTYEFVLQHATDKHDKSIGGDTDITRSFQVVVKDVDDSIDDKTFISIKIHDDQPTAVNDSKVVTEDAEGDLEFSAVTGNVLDNDRIGMDGFKSDAQKVQWNVSDTPKYGTIVRNSDGSYSYELTNDNSAVQHLKPGETLTETFTYTITDKDNDTSTATLTITINGKDDVVSIEAENKADFSGVINSNANINVDEAGLEFDAAGAVTKTVTQSGAINITAPDGLASIFIGDDLVWQLDNEATGAGSLRKTEFATDEGKLTINGYENGRLTYTYELLKATQEHTGHNPEQIDVYSHSFDIKAVDRNDSEDQITLSINIKDDNPVAHADAKSVKGDDNIAAGNVLLNDDFGADGLRSFTWIDNAKQPINVDGSYTINAKYGTMVLNEDGSYTYTLNKNHPDVLALLTDEPLKEEFLYKITDKDGDESFSSITVNIFGENDPVTVTPNNSTPISDTIPDLPYQEDVRKNAAIDNQSEVEISESAIGTDDAVKTGSIHIDAPDGLKLVKVGGVEVYKNGVFNAQTISTDEGDLKITSLDSSGNLTYEFTLKNATDKHDKAAGGDEFVTRSFNVYVEDMDGSNNFKADEAKTFISIKIKDDKPTALNDSKVVTEDAEGDLEFSAVKGNVLDNDRIGMDGFKSDAQKVDWDLTQNAQYGTISRNPDGSYSYELNNSHNAVQHLKPGETLTETFAYTITDKDNDTSTATLTITINGKDDIVTLTSGNAGDSGNQSTVLVDEANLEINAAGIVTKTVSTSGAILINAPDGLRDISIGGQKVWELTNEATGAGILKNTEFTTDEGVLTVTSYENGRLSYTYTLIKPTQEHSVDDRNNVIPEILEHRFTVSATDRNDSPGEIELVIKIQDAVAKAENDANSVTEGNSTAITGDVLLNDSFGADGKAAFGYVSLVSDDQPHYGTLVLNSDGTYSYSLNNSNAVVKALSSGETLPDIFTYQIKDADGDTSTATLTITINGVDNGVVVAPANPVTPDLANVPDMDGMPADAVASQVVVNENALKDSSVTSSEGIINITALDGLKQIEIDGEKVWENGSLTDKTEFSTDEGKFVIKSFDAATGQLKYEYVLEQASAEHSKAGGDAISHSFEIKATDADNSTNANKVFVSVKIVDDIPVAEAAVSEVLTGENVIEGSTLAGTFNINFGADGPGDIKFIAVNGNDPANPIDINPSVKENGDLEFVIENVNGMPNGVLTLHKNSDSANEEWRYEFTPKLSGKIDASSLKIQAIDNDGDRADITINISLDHETQLENAGSEMVDGVLILDRLIIDEGNQPQHDGDKHPAGDKQFTVVFNGESGEIEICSDPEIRDGIKIAIDSNAAGSKWTYMYDSETVIANGVKLSINDVTETSPGKWTVNYHYEYANNIGQNHVKPDNDLSLDTEFNVIVKGEGIDDIKTGKLLVSIHDEAPIARDDIGNIVEDAAIVAGNVIVGYLDGEVLKGDDSTGKDGFTENSAKLFGYLNNDLTITNAVQNGNEFTVNGKYGSIIFDNAGNYVYSLDNQNSSVKRLTTNEILTEKFKYQITDSDGDTAEAVLNVVISGVDHEISVITSSLSEVTVDENNLNNLAENEFVESSNSIKIAAPDDLKTIKITDIDGTEHIIFENGALTENNEVKTDEGRLIITSVLPDVDNPDNLIVNYKFRLEHSTQEHGETDKNTNVSHDFALKFYDYDNSETNATIRVNITDDVPETLNIESKTGSKTDNIENVANADNIIGNYSISGSFEIDFGADNARNNPFVLIGKNNTEISAEYDAETKTYTFNNNNNENWNLPKGTLSISQTTGNNWNYKFEPADGNSFINVPVSLKAYDKDGDSTDINFNISLDYDSVVERHPDSGNMPSDPVIIYGDKEIARAVIDEGDNPGDSHNHAKEGQVKFLANLNNGDGTIEIGKMKITVQDGVATIGGDANDSVLGTVFTIASATQDPATHKWEIVCNYSYDSAQTGQIHNQPENKDVLKNGLQIVVTDNNDDKDYGTLAVEIHDDKPFAAVYDLELFEGKRIEGSVLDDSDYHADGQGTFQIGEGDDAFNVQVKWLDVAADQEHKIDENGQGYYEVVKTREVDGVIETVGTAKLYDNGEYNFKANISDKLEGEDTTSVSFGYMIVDSDGDTSENNLNITVKADANVPEITINKVIPDGDKAAIRSGNIIVDEASLATGSGSGDTDHGVSGTGSFTIDLKGETGIITLSRADADGSNADNIVVVRLPEDKDNLGGTDHTLPNGVKISFNNPEYIVSEDNPEQGYWKFTYTYSFTEKQTHNDAEKTGADDSLDAKLLIHVKDETGDEQDASILVSVHDDAPVFSTTLFTRTETDSNIEGVKNTLSGKINVNFGADEANADNPFYVKNADNSLKAHDSLIDGKYEFNVDNGKLSIWKNADNEWMYEFAPSHNNKIDQSFTIVAKDSDGDTKEAAVNVFRDFAPEISTETNVPVADNERLAHIQVDEGNQPQDPAHGTEKHAASGTVKFFADLHDGDGSITIGDKLAVTIANGEASYSTTNSETVNGIVVKISNAELKDGKWEITCSYDYDRSIGDEDVKEYDYDHRLVGQTHDKTANDFNLAGSLNVVVKDADNQEIKGVIDIDLHDDAPKPEIIFDKEPVFNENNEILVKSGEDPVYGNVKYNFGADFGENQGTVLVYVNGSDIGVPVNLGRGAAPAIKGAFGELDIDRTGRFAYRANPLKIVYDETKKEWVEQQGGKDTFYFEIIDADGDKVTLGSKTEPAFSFDISKPLVTIEPKSIEIMESNLGNDMASQRFAVFGNYAVVGNAENTADTNVYKGQYGTFHITDATYGRGYYVQEKAYTHEGQGSDRKAGADTINLIVEDYNGNQFWTSIIVNITDDVPIANDYLENSISDALSGLFGNIDISHAKSDSTLDGNFTVDFGKDGANSTSPFELQDGTKFTKVADNKWEARVNSFENEAGETITPPAGKLVIEQTDSGYHSVFIADSGHQFDVEIPVYAVDNDGDKAKIDIHVKLDHAPGLNNDQTGGSINLSGDNGVNLYEGSQPEDNADTQPHSAENTFVVNSYGENVTLKIGENVSIALNPDTGSFDYEEGSDREISLSNGVKVTIANIVKSENGDWTVTYKCEYDTTHGGQTHTQGGSEVENLQSVLAVKIIDENGGEKSGQITVNLHDDKPVASFISGGEQIEDSASWLEGQISVNFGADSFHAEHPFKIGDKEPSSVNMEAGKVEFTFAKTADMPAGKLILERIESTNNWKYKFETSSGDAFDKSLQLTAYDNDNDASNVINVSFGQDLKPSLIGEDNIEGSENIALDSIVVDEGNQPDLHFGETVHTPHGKDGDVSFIANLHNGNGEINIQGLRIKLKEDGGTELFKDESNADIISSNPVNGVSLSFTSAVLDAATGQWTITCRYEFSGAGQSHKETDGKNIHQDLSVVLTDSNNNTATGTISLDIHDDKPVFLNKSSGSIDEGATDVSGAVLFNPGADGSEKNIEWANINGAGEVIGLYGKLIANADGTWSYQLNNDSQSVRELTELKNNNNVDEEGKTYLKDRFSYSITDTDNDTVSQTLVVRINGKDNVIEITPDNPVGEGENIHSEKSVSETDLGTDNVKVSDSFTINAPDGLKSIAIGDAVVWENGELKSGVIIKTHDADNNEGELAVKSYDVATGRLEYEFVLKNATSEQGTDGRDTNSISHEFVVTVKDTDDSSATSKIVINIEDDAPVVSEALADAKWNGWQYDSKAAEGKTLSGAFDIDFGKDIQKAIPLSVKLGDNSYQELTEIRNEDGSLAGWTYTDAATNGVLNIMKGAGNTYLYSYELPAGTNLNFAKQFVIRVSDIDDSVETTISVGQYNQPTIVNKSLTPDNWTDAIEFEIGCIVVDEAALGKNGGGVNTHGKSGTGSFEIDLHGGDGVISITAGGNTLPSIVIENGVINADLADKVFDSLACGVKFDNFNISELGNGKYSLSYHYELVENIEHDKETHDVINNFGAILNVNVSDKSNYDDANVSVTVYDDMPVIQVNADDLIADLDAVSGGSISSATYGKINFSFGADDNSKLIIINENADGSYDATNSFNPDNLDSLNEVQLAHGKFTINKDGSWTYKANPLANPDSVVEATENIRIKIVDSDGDSVEKVLKIDITKPSLGDIVELVQANESDYGTDANHYAINVIEGYKIVNIEEATGSYGNIVNEGTENNVQAYYVLNKGFKHIDDTGNALSGENAENSLFVTIEDGNGNRYRVPVKVNISDDDIDRGSVESSNLGEGILIVNTGTKASPSWRKVASDEIGNIRENIANNTWAEVKYVTSTQDFGDLKINGNDLLVVEGNVLNKNTVGIDGWQMNGGVVDAVRLIDADNNEVSINATEEQKHEGYASLNGQYGTLYLKADGSYIYERNTSFIPGQKDGDIKETFTYRVYDSDKSFVENKIEINISNSPILNLADAAIGFDEGNTPYEGEISSDDDSIFNYLFASAEKVAHIDFDGNIDNALNAAKTDRETALADKSLYVYENMRTNPMDFYRIENPGFNVVNAENTFIWYKTDWTYGQEPCLLGVADNGSTIFVRMMYDMLQNGSVRFSSIIKGLFDNKDSQDIQISGIKIDAYDVNGNYLPDRGTSLPSDIMDTDKFKDIANLGEKATAGLTITIKDSAPTAVNDERSGIEGGDNVEGNVIAGYMNNGTLQGKDSYKTDGAGEFKNVDGVDGDNRAVLWLNLPEGTEHQVVDGKGFYELNTDRYSVKLYDNGDYVFKPLSDNKPADEFDETNKRFAFDYQIIDSDGSKAKAQLIVTIDKDTRVPEITINESVPDGKSITVAPDPETNDGNIITDEAALRPGKTSEYGISGTSSFDVKLNGESGEIALNTVIPVKNAEGAFEDQTVTVRFTLPEIKAGQTAEVQNLAGKSFEVANGVKIDLQNATYDAATEKWIINFNYNLERAQKHVDDVTIYNSFNINVTDATGDVTRTATYSVAIQNDKPEKTFGSLIEDSEAQNKGSFIVDFGGDGPGEDPFEIENGTLISKTEDKYIYKIEGHDELPPGKMVISKDEDGNWKYSYIFNPDDENLNYDGTIILKSVDGDGDKSDPNPIHVKRSMSPDANPELDMKIVLEDRETLDENSSVHEATVQLFTVSNTFEKAGFDTSTLNNIKIKGAVDSDYTWNPIGEETITVTDAITDSKTTKTITQKIEGVSSNGHKITLEIVGDITNKGVVTVKATMDDAISHNGTTQNSAGNDVVKIYNIQIAAKDHNLWSVNNKDISLEIRDYGPQPVIDTNSITEGFLVAQNESGAWAIVSVEQLESGTWRNVQLITKAGTYAEYGNINIPESKFIVSGNVRDNDKSVDGWRVDASGKINAVELIKDGNAVEFGSDGYAVIEGKYGSIRLKADGSYEYERNAKYVTDSNTLEEFEYRIYDSDNTSETSKIQITVNPVNVNNVDLKTWVTVTDRDGDSFTKGLFVGKNNVDDLSENPENWKSYDWTTDKYPWNGEPHPIYGSENKYLVQLSSTKVHQDGCNFVDTGFDSTSCDLRHYEINVIENQRQAPWCGSQLTTTVNAATGRITVYIAGKEIDLYKEYGVELPKVSSVLSTGLGWPENTQASEVNKFKNGDSYPENYFIPLSITDATGSEPTPGVNQSDYVFTIDGVVEVKLLYIQLTGYVDNTGKQQISWNVAKSFRVLNSVDHDKLTNDDFKSLGYEIRDVLTTKNSAGSTTFISENHFNIKIWDDVPELKIQNDQVIAELISDNSKVSLESSSDQANADKRLWMKNDGTTTYNLNEMNNNETWIEVSDSPIGVMTVHKTWSGKYEFGIKNRDDDTANRLNAEMEAAETPALLSLDENPDENAVMAFAMRIEDEEADSADNVSTEQQADNMIANNALQAENADNVENIAAQSSDEKNIEQSVENQQETQQVEAKVESDADDHVDNALNQAMNEVEIDFSILRNSQHQNNLADNQNVQNNQTEGMTNADVMGGRDIVLQPEDAMESVDLTQLAAKNENAAQELPNNQLSTIIEQSAIETCPENVPIPSFESMELENAISELNTAS